MHSRTAGNSSMCSPSSALKNLIVAASCSDFFRLKPGPNSESRRTQSCLCMRINEFHISDVQGAYKLSEDFAKPHFQKYWTETHEVTTIWKRNVCSFIVTLNAFDVLPSCDTSHKTCLRGFGRNGSIAWTSALSHEGRTSNAFNVTMKLQTFLFQMVVTSCISVQYLWKYGFAKSSINLYALCILRRFLKRKWRITKWSVCSEQWAVLELKIRHFYCSWYLLHISEVPDNVRMR